MEIKEVAEQARDPRLAAIPDSHGHAKGEHKPFSEERPIPYTARMLFLWFFHACRRGSPRFMMVADHMNYLTFEDPAAVNLVRRALKLAQAGDLFGAAETAGVEVGHAEVVSKGLRRGMRYSIGAEVDNDPRSRPDAQNIVDAMKPDGMVRSVHFLPITHPTHGENWMWAFDNPEFRDLYEVVGTQTVWEIYMATLLDAIEKLPGHIVGHFYVPAIFGHWPDDAVLEGYEDKLVDACAQRGMAIELNSRYIYKHYLGDDVQLEKFRTAHVRLMRKAKEKNVEIAVGSDAHSPKDQGRAFEAVLALLDEVEINEIAFPIGGRLARVALRATEETMKQYAPPEPEPLPSPPAPEPSAAAADETPPAKAKKPRPSRSKAALAAAAEAASAARAANEPAAATEPDVEAEAAESAEPSEVELTELVAETSPVEPELEESVASETDLEPVDERKAESTPDTIPEPAPAPERVEAHESAPPKRKASPRKSEAHHATQREGETPNALERLANVAKDVFAKVVEAIVPAPEPATIEAESRHEPANDVMPIEVREETKPEKPAPTKAPVTRTESPKRAAAKTVPVSAPKKSATAKPAAKPAAKVATKKAVSVAKKAAPKKAAPAKKKAAPAKPVAKKSAAKPATKKAASAKKSAPVKKAAAKKAAPKKAAPAKKSAVKKSAPKAAKRSAVKKSTVKKTSAKKPARRR